MAEFKRLPTQQELDQILYMQGLRPRPTSDIVQSNLASQTISSLPSNVFQKMAGGAGIAKEAVNKLGSASDLAKLFPGYTGKSNVNIPTGYNFAMKQDPMGGVMPSGLQTQQVNVDQLLKAIKPADVLGLTGAQQAYSDVGMGRAPNPMDVLDVAGLGAAGLGTGKGLLKTGVEAGKFVAPKVGQMAEQYAANTGLLSPLVAYHGTPHTFEKFDISKVGTGEGAQAYGHGMYFAEAPGVARGYQMALGQKAGETTTIGGKPIEIMYEQIYNKANKLPSDKAAVEYQKAEMLEKMMLDKPPNEVISYAKDIGADPSVIKWLETEIAPKTKFPGSFYKVDIPDEAIETFLDWDKPLSKQKDLVAKITPEALGLEYKQLPNGNHAYVNAEGKPFSILQKGGTKESFDNRWKESLLMQNSGGELYKALNQGLDNAAKTSAALNKAGIQGIKYLDQSSRADGKGTRNFVVFDPSMVKMLERNNEPIKGLLENADPNIKNVDNKFDVISRDASDIFGAGAQRIMYTDPNSGGFIDVLVKPDKTASVMNLLVPEKFRGKKIGESLQAQALKDFPELSGQVSKKAAAKTAYRLGRRPPYMPNASLEDVFAIIDENSSVNLVSPEMQKRFK